MKLKNKNLLLIKDKQAQIGETITWVVATIIIIVIVIFSIFVTSLIGKDKEFKILSKKDLLATKSLSGYLLTQDDLGKKVFEQLKDEENLSEFSGGLAVMVFEGLYKKDYPDEVWFGIYFEGIGGEENEYFELSRRTRFRGAAIKPLLYISEKIHLKNNKYIKLSLMKL